MSATFLSGQPQVPGQINVVIITYNNHGFSAGNAIYRTNGGWAKSLADTPGDPATEVTGVVQQILDVNNFVIVYSGVITFNSADISNLQDGTMYFLSAVLAGMLVTAPPVLNTQVIKAVMMATGPSSGVVQNYTGWEIIAASSAKFHVNLNNVNQSITNGVTAKILFSTKVIDTANGFDNTTNFQYGVQVGGYYFLYIAGEVSLLSGSSSVYIQKNGTTIAESDNTSGSSVNVSVEAKILVSLAVSDAITFAVSHSSGSAKNLLGTNSLTYAGGYQVV